MSDPIKYVVGFLFNEKRDYVVLINYRHIILEYLVRNHIEVRPSDYNDGFYFVYEGKLVNIISKITVEFMAWREALDILKSLSKIDAIYAAAIKNKMSTEHRLKNRNELPTLVGVLTYEAPSPLGKG